MPENALRVGWTFLDTSGASLPWLAIVLQKPAQGIFPDVEQAGSGGDFHFQVDSSVQEDLSTFGPIGFLLFVPGLFIIALSRRFRPPLRVLAIASLTYFVVFAATIEYNVWVGRVLLPMVALGAPLLAAFYRRRWTRIAAVVLAVTSVGACVISNQQKPLLVPKGQKNILERDHIAQQTIARPEMDLVIRYVLGQIRPGQTLGLAGAEDSWDYPFFGMHRDRRVVRLVPQEVTYDVMRQKGLTAVLFENVGPPPPPLRGKPIGPDCYFVRSPAAVP